MINSYYEILHNSVFSRTINDVVIVNELNGFVESRLAELVNLDTKKTEKEVFEPSEVKMLKGLINKVSVTQPKTVQEISQQVQLEQPKVEVPQTVPSLITSDNMDPIVKAALEEEQKLQEQKQENPVKPKYGQVIPPNYQRASPTDNNAYAMQQASAAQKRYDKQVQTRQGDRTIG